MSESEHTSDPVSVLNQYYSALNEGREEDAIHLFAEDAVYSMTTAPDATMIIVKGEKIAHQIRARIREAIYTELRGFQVLGDQVECYAQVSTDYWRQAGLAPIEEKVEVVVERGKIKTLRTAWTSETLRRVRVRNMDSPGEKTAKKRAKNRKLRTTSRRSRRAR